MILRKFILCLVVCRLSSGSACNIHGTNNCSTTLCNCKIEYKGYLCEKCNWREFYFASHGIDGTIDEMNGYGVTCKKGIPLYFERLSNACTNSSDTFHMI